MGEEQESGGAGVPDSQSRTKAAPAAKYLRPAGRKRGAQGTLPPTTGCLARVAPLSSGPPDPKIRGYGPAASPGAIPAVGVDTLEGGGGGHGAEERGRLAWQKSAEKVGSKGRRGGPHLTTGDRCRSLRHRLPGWPPLL